MKHVTYILLLNIIFLLGSTGCSRQDSYEGLSYIEYAKLKKELLNFIDIPHTARDIAFEFSEEGSRQNRYKVTFCIEGMQATEVISYINIKNKAKLVKHSDYYYASIDKGFIVKIDNYGKFIIELNDAYLR